MNTKNIYKLGMVALFSVVLAACQSTTTDEEEGMDGANGVGGNGRAATEGTATGVDTGPQLSEAELREQRRQQEMLQERVFYFDFDQSDLKPAAREALVYHANQLKANSNMSVRLEGHADERGTREYNLALGERRAQAVERYLQVQGVPSRQIEVISYGEEMPVDTGSSENAYSLNRRVELIYN